MGDHQVEGVDRFDCDVVDRLFRVDPACELHAAVRAGRGGDPDEALAALQVDTRALRDALATLGGEVAEHHPAARPEVAQEHGNGSAAGRGDLHRVCPRR
jgi:hypothetical protein